VRPNLSAFSARSVALASLVSSLAFFRNAEALACPSLGFRAHRV